MLKELWILSDHFSNAENQKCDTSLRHTFMICVPSVNITYIQGVNWVIARVQEGGWRPWCSPAAMMKEPTTLCPDGPVRACLSSAARTVRSECTTLDPSQAGRDTPPPSPSELHRCRLWAAGWASGLLLLSPAAPARLSEACGKSQAGRRSSRRREEAAGERKGNKTT